MQLSIRKLLISTTWLFVAGFLVFSYLAYDTLSVTKVGGSYFARIEQGKDLIADVLPPPGYIIESYLTVLELCDETDPERTSALMDRIGQLELGYGKSHEFWVRTLPDGPLKDAMVVRAYEPAEKFYASVRGELLPIVVGGDRDAAHQIVEVKLRPLYETHRRFIDDVVRMATVRNNADESSAHETVVQRVMFLGLIGCLLVASIAVFSTWLGRRIVSRLKETVCVLEAVAGGDLEQQLIVTGSDEFSHLANSLNQAIATSRTNLIAARQAERALSLQNQSLEEQRQRAEAADRSKSEFLANMSHEIRTPITAILGFAELLLEEGDIEKAPERRIEAIHTIQRNGEHLLGVINHILDLSKIEAGKLTTESIAYSPMAIIEEVLSLVRVRSYAKGLTLEVAYETGLPVRIVTDPTRLRQILVNLLDNAIKFTEAGSVRLVVRLDRADAPTLEFDVVDSGIGLTPAQRERLFRPFSQADSSTTRKFGGTGLGLTISKRLAQLLGGDVSIVDSTSGVGTRFRVTVPTGSLDDVEIVTPGRLGDAKTVAPKPADTPCSLAGFRVLLAEDGPDNQRLISFVLKRVGAEVTVMENGQLAVDAALQAVEDDRPFDVILMDMQMPVLDGYGAVRLLRTRAYRGCVIALTAHAMSGDRDKCLAAGCDDYATKPIDRAKLIAQIASQVSVPLDRCATIAT